MADEEHLRQGPRFAPPLDCFNTGALTRNLLPWMERHRLDYARCVFTDPSYELEVFFRRRGRRIVFAMLEGNENYIFASSERGRSLDSFLEAHELNPQETSVVAYDPRAPKETPAPPEPVPEELPQELPTAQTPEASVTVSTEPEPPQDEIPRVDPADAQAPAQRATTRKTLTSAQRARRKGEREKARRDQKKERDALEKERKYQEILALAHSTAELLMARGDQQGNRGLLNSGFGQVGDFFVKNPELRGRAAQEIRARSMDDPLRLYLSTMTRHAMSALPKIRLYDKGKTMPGGFNQMIQRNAFRALQALADQVFPESEHIDPLRTHEAHHMRYESRRDASQYGRLLFPDLGGPIEFIGYLLTRAPQEKEIWVDVGAGVTYQEPTSLMNLIHLINKNIDYICYDPLYSTETAAPVDVARGRAEIKRLYPEQQLIPGFAQDLKFETESVHQLLSCWAFDKIPHDNDGELQALREVARVLRPGGIARIYPLSPELLATHIGECFEIIAEVTDLDADGTGEAKGYVLEKKKLAPEILARIVKESSDWKAAYMPKK